ncbi:MAG: bifunctional 4-hydroxy-2-oxoglutarate aldolase/2-dehydro-3-deoxy-phosphogluconate aldolase [Anaerolineae bacterium]|nr:bifunctional 4-hydroxy-2-oxoglutarate aldolase/2-dehydro-3-deoxy-phosphogluconate aldolase [Anaerolineae bacterium]
MAKYDRLTVYNTALETGLVPVFYHGDAATARKIAAACYAGGIRVLEFTNRGDRAWNVFNELIQFVEKELPGAILGVGSVVDAPTAALYIASGANFVVGPMLNPEVARLCNRRKVGYMPGCGTIGEISEAEELGVEIVKVFPGETVGGPAFVKAVRGPMPWTRIMPTGGVKATQDNIAAWIKAGVACLGIGSDLVRKDWVSAGEFDKIEQTARQVLAWIKEARG